MRAIFMAIVLSAALVLASAPPTKASIVTTRCTSLTTALNAKRVDVRQMNLLCTVGAHRAYEMARAGHLWHDLGPVRRALWAASICWRNVGEVLAWNDHDASGSVFMAQWKASANHWPILMDTQYDHGGGAWTGYLGKYWAAYYVIDLC